MVTGNSSVSQFEMYPYKSFNFLTTLSVLVLPFQDKVDKVIDTSRPWLTTEPETK